VTTILGKPSATGQPSRPTQSFIFSGSINWVGLPVLIACGKRGNVTSAGWQVTRCDPLSSHSTTPTPTSSRGTSPTRPTRAISLSYSCGKLNDTPTFSRRSSRGCRRRGMRALWHMSSRSSEAFTLLTCIVWRRGSPARLHGG